MQQHISRVLAFASVAVFATACATSRPAQSSAAASTPSPAIAMAQRCDNWNVYFNTGSSDVSPTARSALSGLAECVKRGHVSTIYLIGSSDPRGGNVENNDLGLARANSIRSVLIDYGCPSSLVVSYTIGERYSENDPSEYPTQRRVNIRTFPNNPANPT